MLEDNPVHWVYVAKRGSVGWSVNPVLTVPWGLTARQVISGTPDLLAQRETEVMLVKRDPLDYRERSEPPDHKAPQVNQAHRVQLDRKVPKALKGNLDQRDLKDQLVCKALQGQTDLVGSRVAREHLDHQDPPGKMGHQECLELQVNPAIQVHRASLV